MTRLVNPLTRNGKFEVGIGITEIGQGMTIAFAQIAAEALQCGNGICMGGI